jgi:L-serine deaminase
MIALLPFNQFLLGHGRLQRLTWPIVAVNLLTVAAMATFGATAGGTGVAAALLGGTALGLLPLSLRETVAVWRVP